MSLLFACEYRYDEGFHLKQEFVAGEGITAICGPSGIGKTTILRLIVGLLRPERGRIALADHVLVDIEAGRWLKPEDRGIGFVAQDSLLFPHMSVRKNLEYGSKRKPNQELSFDRVVGVLEVGDLLDRSPATLSGGQARRVAIGRALLSGPRLLMLDEPWSGLDEAIRNRIAELVQRIVTEWQIPTLLVSHDQGFTGELADQSIEISAK